MNIRADYGKIDVSQRYANTLGRDDQQIRAAGRKDIVNRPCTPGKEIAMSDKQFIYALYRHGTEEYRYVGKTKSPGARLKSHRSCRYKETNPALYEWVGEDPDTIEMMILDVVEDDALGREREWCKRLSYSGHRLFNLRRPRKLTKQERVNLMKQYLSAAD